MYRTKTRHSTPELGTFLEITRCRDKQLVVSRERLGSRVQWINRGTISVRGDWDYVLVPLAVDAELSFHGQHRTCPVGSLVGYRSNEAVWGVNAPESDMLVICARAETGALTPFRGISSIDLPSLERLRWLVEKMTHEQEDALAVDAVAQIGDLLQNMMTPSTSSESRSLELPNLRNLIVPTSAGDQAIGKLLASAVQTLSNVPRGIDLSVALGASERHALRLVNEHIAKFFAGPRTWRDYLFCNRILLGVLLMSSGKVRTDDASAWLGFTTPTTFCHALSSVGLPSPGRIASELKLAA